MLPMLEKFPRLKLPMLPNLGMYDIMPEEGGPEEPRGVVDNPLPTTPDGVLG